MSFFFSSRRRHTRCGRDWSSDVCSSDLHRARQEVLSDLADGGARQPGERVGVGDRGGGAPGLEAGGRSRHADQIGRGSCRGRGEISVGAVSLKKKKKKEARIDKIRQKNR